MPGLAYFPGGDTMQIPLDPCTGFAAVPGNAQVSLTWTDPKDKYATPEGETAQDPNQLVSQWAYTKLVRKTGSAPTGPNDGVTVAESGVRNQYQTAPYVDEGLQNDTAYFYAVYAVNEDGVASGGAGLDITPTTYRPVLADNSWAEIAEASAAGRAQEFWQVGDEKVFSIGGTTYISQIIGFNHDDLSDGSGKAGITFGLKGLFSEIRVLGGSFYPESQIHSWLNGDIFDLIDQELKAVIKDVNKISKSMGYTDPNDYLLKQSVNPMKLFIFGNREVGYTRGDDRVWNDGTLYPYFATAANRAKGKPWWTRFFYVSSKITAWNVSADGDVNSYSFDNEKQGVCFGFCV